MRNKWWINFVFLWIAAIFSTAFSFEWIASFGPMFHVYFGKKVTYGFSIEASYWYYQATPGDKYKLPIPMSIDAAIEFNSNGTLLYSELQTGVVFAGASAGPVLQFNKDGSKLYGFQSSVWGAFIGGIDFRYRRLGGENLFAPGIFAKIGDSNRHVGD